MTSSTTGTTGTTGSARSRRLQTSHHSLSDPGGGRRHRHRGRDGASATGGRPTGSPGGRPRSPDSAAAHDDHRLAGWRRDPRQYTGRGSRRRVA